MGFDEEHPLATIDGSMLERTHPDYKETPDIEMELYQVFD